MTKETNGVLFLDDAKELFRYRLRFLQGVIRASPAGGEREAKKKLKKLFGIDVHDTDDEKVWNRIADAIFQFIDKERQREQRTSIDTSQKMQPKNIASRREWLKGVTYFAHLYHQPSTVLANGEGSDELSNETAETDTDNDSVHDDEIVRKRKKKQPKAGESGDTMGDFDTDNEEHYWSDYELEESGQRAEWSLNHATEVTEFIRGLNSFLRLARSSRAVLGPQHLVC